MLVVNTALHATLNICDAASDGTLREKRSANQTMSFVVSPVFKARCHPSGPGGISLCRRSAAKNGIVYGREDLERLPCHQHERSTVFERF